MISKNIQTKLAKALVLVSVYAIGFSAPTRIGGIDHVAYARSLYVTTDTVKLRSGADFSDRIVGSIPANRPVDVIKVYKGGAWAKVKYNGKTGYMHTMYLTLKDMDKDTSSPSKSSRNSSRKSLRSDGYHMVVKGGVNFRTRPSSRSKRIGYLADDKDVLIIAKTGNWYKVYVNGRYGYVSGRYLADYQESSSSSSKKSSSSKVLSGNSTKGGSLRSDGYHMITTNAVNFRKDNSKYAAKIGTLPAGSDVLIIDKQKDWYKVYVSGRYGYVHGDYLKDYGTSSPSSSRGNTSNSSSSNKGGAYRSDGFHMLTKRTTNVRKGPGTRYGIREKVSADTDVLLIDAQKGYYKVYLNGRYSYIRKSDLKNYPSSSKNTTQNTSAGNAGHKVVKKSGKKASGSKSSKINIHALGNYGKENIRISGNVSSTPGSVSVFLNGTYLALASVNGKNFSYTIPKSVTKPGSNSLRIQTSVNGATIYQTETFYVNKQPTIVLDPGHGGNNPGTIAYHNGRLLREEDYAWKITSKLKSRLQDYGFNVIMARSSGSDPSLDARANLANKYDADLFISLHHNSAHPSARGGLTLYPSMKYNASTQASFTESQAISNSFESAYTKAGMPSRGSWRDADISGGSLYVLRNTKGRSILTEMGFLSNSADADLISDPGFQSRLASNMAKEIRDFFYKN